MKRADPAQQLVQYRRKRDFSRTPEPADHLKGHEENIFVVQKHAASHLHYDFRLRLHGTLKSWALSKGPSLDPSQRRLARETEDHPLSYADFEGVIPAGNYGAGTVMVWDRGLWEPLGGGKKDYYRGRLEFALHGERLKGKWALIREDKEGSRDWFLIKEPDQFATQQDILKEETSIATGRTLEEIGSDRDRLWTSDKGEVPAAAPGVFGHPSGGSLPDLILPQSATLVASIPKGDWGFEIKFDGYRALCRIDKGGKGIRFYTRKGFDFTDQLPNLCKAVSRLPITQGWIDGEIVVLTPDGRSDFHALQNTLRYGSNSRIVYFVFDLMNYEGYDIREAPLSERKALLAELIPEMDEVRYVEHLVGQGEEFYRAACAQRLEGIVSKRLDAVYQSQRTRTWLKIKCSQQQEYVIGGYTESGAGRPFGSLLAGFFDPEGQFVFCGKIKSGYSISRSKALLETLKQYEQYEPSFVNPPSGREYRNPHWLKPELVAEVAFGELSGTGLLRHASFKGLREDKNAREVGIELPEPLPDEETEPEPKQEVERDLPREPRPPKPPATKERPVFPHERITRDEIMAYYNMVAGRMLPHIADRPLTLIVCRTNIYACKFTKHATNLPAPVKAIDAGHEERYIAVDSLAGLQALVKAGMVELHGWQSRYTDLERPDRMIFDLDPPEETPLPWQRLAEAALLLRLHLQEKGLESFLQTTGGKGYYVVVPLRPAATWKTVTPFAKRVAREMEARYPDRFTARLAKEERKGRIYVDWMRNGRGANAAEPYSIRARPGAPVATPITWEELVDGVRPDAFNVRNIGKRLDAMAHDPWQDYLEVSQQIGEA